jgi:hypothetical protein
VAYWLILFAETVVADYSENRAKHINTLCGKNKDFYHNVKRAGVGGGPPERVAPLFTIELTLDQTLGKLVSLHQVHPSH